MNPRKQIVVWAYLAFMVLFWFVIAVVSVVNLWTKSYPHVLVTSANAEIETMLIGIVMTGVSIGVLASTRE